jgi:glucokinase
MEALTRASVVAAAAGKATMEEVIAGVESGDRRSIAAVEEAAAYLGIGLANVVTVLGPERIVVGGGVAEAGEVLLGPIREAIRNRVTLVPRDQVEVVPAVLGPEAGAIGAALAAIESPTRDQRFLHGEIPSAQLRREEQTRVPNAHPEDTR